MLVLRFKPETSSIPADYTVGNIWATLVFQGLAFKIKTQGISDSQRNYVNKPGLKIESTEHVSLIKILFSWYIILFLFSLCTVEGIQSSVDNLFVFDFK